MEASAAQPDPPRRRLVLYAAGWLLLALFTVLRYFALDGTDHVSRKEQGSMIRRYIILRNKHAADERLRDVVSRAIGA